MAETGITIICSLWQNRVNCKRCRIITTKSGADEGGTSHVTYNFRLTNQMLGKKAEIFGTQEYIDYQTYIGQMTPELLETVWDGKEHDWFDEVFAPSW